MVEDDLTSRELLERAIISAVFSWPQKHADIFPNLRHFCFNDEQLSIIYDCADKIWKRGEVPDFITIRRELELEEGIPPSWFNRRAFEFEAEAYTQLGVIPDNVPSWIAQLLRHERFSEFKQGAARARTIDDLVGVCTKALEPQGLVGKEDEVTWQDEVASFLDLQERISSGEITHGSTWGIVGLDEVVMLCPGKLYVIGAIKKGGKSHLLQHTAIMNALAGQPVFVFSLEMSKDDVARRWFAHQTGVNSFKILTQRLSEDEHARMKAQAAALATLPITINQQARITPKEISARINTWIRKNKVPEGKGVVTVDFLQLMPLDEMKGQSEASALKANAYELARIAKETRVAIVAAAQLRNEAEGQKPNLGFLEGSGGIAQAAEGIILLDLYSRRGAGEQCNGFESLDFIVHQRNGESGKTIPASVDLSTSRFF